MQTPMTSMYNLSFLIINELAKGKTNYFSSFYPIFYAILIPTRVNNKYHMVFGLSSLPYKVVSLLFYDL